MAFDHWDKQPDGNLTTCPLLSYELGTAQMFALLRLSYARDQQEFETGGVGLQLTMTPVQLRELAKALLRTADTIDQQQLGTRQ